ncbi:t-SNARE [Ascosphaera aggregata]|nr:t-SNARE [Ascosphaera aggregata]
MSQADPFLQVQEDVLSSISTLRSLVASHNRIRSIAKSPSNPELNQSRAELNTTLSDLEADFEDLSQSVRVIEHDPYRYGIELDELERRRHFLADIQVVISDMKHELERQDTQNITVGGVQAAAAAQRGQISTTATSAKAGQGVAATGGLPPPSNFDDYEDDDHVHDGGERGDDYYAAMEQERQMEMMAEQDQQLDGVFRTVGNLRAQADDMGRELEEQAGIIENVDTLADRVGSKLKTGARRMSHIIAKNEGTIMLLQKKNPFWGRRERFA